MTTLLAAAEVGDEGECLRALEQGGDVDGVDGHGRTPLFMASWKGHRGVCALLLEHGANVHKMDRTAPLHFSWRVKRVTRRCASVLTAAPVWTSRRCGMPPAVGERCGNDGKAVYEGLHLSTWRVTRSHGCLRAAADRGQRRPGHQDGTHRCAASQNGHKEVCSAARSRPTSTRLQVENTAAAVRTATWRSARCSSRGQRRPGCRRVTR